MSDVEFTTAPTVSGSGGSPAPRTQPVGDRIAGRECPLCGGPGEPWGERDGYPLRECCGILLSWQWSDVESYTRLYTDPERYHHEQQLREGQRPCWERDSEASAAAATRLQVLERCCPRRVRLLDVGCGTGAFVAAARERGIEAWGLELNAAIAQEARHRGRPVREGGWEAADGSWDVITLLDVLEHLPHPHACLMRLRGLLYPGGTLVVEWPEWGCELARRAGSEWRHIRPLQHLCLYSDPAARRLFARAGLAVTALERPLRGSLGKISYYLQPADDLGEAAVGEG